MSDSQRIYEDFLLPRRREFSNLVWVNKEIKAQLAFDQKNRLSPADHKEAVKQNLVIKQLIKKLNKEKNIPIEVLDKQLENILNEIGYHKNLHIIRSVGLLLTKILLRILNGTYVNYHAIRELKSLMGHCPVVFVPSHRSYADFIIFSYVCFNYDIELPAVAAGMDFQGMFGMGEMLRSIGAFFLRRAKDDDTIYWTAFRQYVYQIVTKGDKPIEFFIEGTRSRSNKTMAPKYDFQGMFGMGEMLRSIGAFFLRRAKDDDTIYWTAFRQYVYQIVTKGDKPIEFFIEGTRSRSNKTMAPKYGLINMILKAFFIGTVSDIIFVPVSICYDRILEESLFAFELLGMPKPKESTSGFFKSLKILKEKFGNIYFHIDHPISSREFFENKVSLKRTHSLGPIETQETTEEEKKVIPSLAYEILRRQQISGVITTFNLIAMILNDTITKGHKSINLKDLILQVENLKECLKCLGAYVFEEDITEAVHANLVIHENLVQMVDGKISLVTNKIVLGNIDAAKLKAHAFSAETMSYALPFFLLQIYCNPVLFHIFDVATLIISLDRRKELTTDELSTHFHFFKNLFAFEFVSSMERESEDFETALRQATQLNLIELDNGLIRLKGNDDLRCILFNSIQPFILTYYVVLEVLERTSETCFEKLILISAQELLEEAINKRETFIHPYCLSLDTLGNCLNSLSSNMNAITKSKRDDKIVYELKRSNVHTIKEQIESYIPSFPVISGFDSFGHIKNKL